MDANSLRDGIIVAAVLCAGITIATHYLHGGRLVLIYIFKPLTTILILVVALLPGTFRTGAYARFIGLGLVFSLAGDIWLMLPGDRFIQGLAAFLLAHVCYILAFLPGGWGAGFAIALLVLGALGVIVLRYLWPGISSGLRVPVYVYSTVIVSMAALAVGGAAMRPSLKTLSAAAGALLFVASDALLTIDRFRRPLRFDHIVVLGTYFAAQLLIALSVG